MTKYDGIEFSTGSATEFDDLICETEIDEKIGLIVSAEDGTYVADIFILENDEKEFAYTKNQSFRRVSLDKLIFALKESRDRLDARFDRKI